MPDPTEGFFAGLAEQGQHPALRRTSGSVRIDIDRDGKVAHWRLDLKGGAVTVSQSDAPADCVIGTPAKLFDELATGKANAMAAALRNELTMEGDPGFLVRFQRLFPAPTGRRMRSSARTVGKRRG
jgi:ubiquinone biosynthesis protein UbiJ